MNKQLPYHPRVSASDTQRRTLTPHELKAAAILSAHFGQEVVFISAARGYKLKTPDVEMNGQMWEIKCPRGNSTKTTVKQQLKRGKHQSRNIILATFATPLWDKFIIKEVKRLIDSKDVRVHKLVVIDKNLRIHIVK